MLQFFAESGVDLDVKDRWGSTPIDDAVAAGWTELADQLKKWVNPPTVGMITRASHVVLPGFEALAKRNAQRRQQ